MFNRKLQKIKKYLLLIVIIGGFLLFLSEHVALAQSTIDPWGGTGAEFQARSGLGATDPRIMVARIINFALGFLGIIAVALMIYAGVVIMKANGNENEISKGKKILIYAVGGLVIILMSFAIANFVLDSLIGATTDTVPSEPCLDGETRTCNLNGIQACVGGFWGPCINEPGGNLPCSSDPDPDVCTQDDSICVGFGDNYYCDSTCHCRRGGNLGDSCNATTTLGVCTADVSLCQDGLYCEENDPNNLCTCQGSPIIDRVSPQGGFCRDGAGLPTDVACSPSVACPNGSTCDLVTPNGREGNFVTIGGRFFGAATGTVYFSSDNWSTSRAAALADASNPACSASAWSDTQIIAVVPNGLAVGSGTLIRVVADRSASSTDTTGNDGRGPILDFVVNGIIRPGLCQMTPDDGRMGDAVAYDGVNFSLAPQGRVYFGNVTASANTRILADNSTINSVLVAHGNVPNLRSGYTSSFIENSGGAYSNYLTFRKIEEFSERHYITRFNPIAGGKGQYVTIFGRGFGSVGSAGLGTTHQVFFDRASELGDNDINQASTLGTPGDFSFPEACDLDSIWRDNRIIVKVPGGLPANGDYHLVIKTPNLDQLIDSSKIVSASAFGMSPTFDYDSAARPAPGLCRIAPEVQMNNYPVEFFGEYFGNVNDGQARFHRNLNVPGTSAASWDDASPTNKASVAVPANAVSGDVAIFSNGTSSNSLTLEIGSCNEAADPDTACGTQFCCSENTPMAGRCAASSNACFGSSTNSVFQWSFNSGNGGQKEGEPCDDDDNLYNGCLANNDCATGLECNLTTCRCQDENDDPESCSDRSADQCLQSESCPNSPGSCSVGLLPPTECAISDYPSLNQTYAYSGDSNRFVDAASACSRDEDGAAGSATLAGVKAVCVPVGGTHYWQYSPGNASCAPGFIREVNGKCTLRVECNVCTEKGTECIDNGTNGDNAGICAYKSEICPDGTTCDNATGECTDNANESCDCCCSIGSGNQQCCAGLTCDGTCGSDTTDDDAGLGKCTGCTVEVNGVQDQELSDQACNCSGTTGKFCDMDEAGGLGTCNDCSTIGNQSLCSEHSTVCCVDAMDDNACSGGIGTDFYGTGTGYCSYYTCDANANTCNGSAASTGETDNVDACNDDCRPGNVEDSCEVPEQPGTCDYDICSNNYECFGNAPTDCGSCCCDMTLAGTENDICADINPILECLYTGNKKSRCYDSDQGSAPESPDFGLCCGCKKDGDCRSTSDTGCGTDACCHSRPEVASTIPADDDANVCRNAEIQVEFNMAMNNGTFNGNVVVFGDYLGGTCPQGTTYLSSGDFKPRQIGFFEKVLDRISLLFRNVLVKITGGQRSFAGYAPDHVYCAVDGTVSGYTTAGDTGILSFKPGQLLDPLRTYYVIVAGDETGSSTKGVKSDYNISMFDDWSENYDTANPGINDADKTFNGKVYHGYAFNFTTLSDAFNQGVCKLDHVEVIPSSYLFKTNKSELAENDYDALHPTFDKTSDADKVFMAKALSVDGQLLATSSQYSWDWSWSSTNNSVADVMTAIDVPGLGLQPINIPANQAFIRATSTAVDGRTEVWARALMTDDDIFNEVGVDKKAKSDVYVFLCENPWPAIASDGSWKPWIDRDANCSIMSDPNLCRSTNYELYYCRDNGKPGTYDDLPAIKRDAVIREASNIYTCNSGFYNTLKYPTDACEGGTGVCTVDRVAGDSVVCEGVCKHLSAGGSLLEKGGVCKIANDCLVQGSCSRNNLKEAYYFRGDVPNVSPVGASFFATSSLANQDGGTAAISWSGTSSSYRLYWDTKESGRANYALVNNIAVGPFASTNNNNLTCSRDVDDYSCTLKGLSNNTKYYFNLTSLGDTDKGESAFYSATDLAVLIRDVVSPDEPSGLAAEAGNKEVGLSWNPVPGALSYRVYYGVMSGTYGLSKDVATASALISGLSNQIEYYFIVKAIDSSGNMSQASSETSATPVP